MMSSGLQGQYAGFLSRAFGFILDVVVIGLTNLAIYWLVSTLLELFTGLSTSACPPLESFNLAIITCHVARWGYTAFAAVFPLLYMLFFWVLTGQTIGNYVAGVRVVRTSGHRVNLISGLIRFFSYFLCLVSLGLGFLWVLVDDRRQGWHDKLARTCVIYAWEARQDGRFIQKLSQRLFGSSQQS